MTERVRVYRVNKSIKSTQDFFADLREFGSLHPLIRNVEKISEEEFKVLERPFSWIPINIKYTAKINRDGEVIIYNISGIPLTKPHLVYSFKALSENQTQIRLFLTIKGIPGITTFLGWKMLRAQNVLMEKLRKS